MRFFPARPHKGSILVFFNFGRCSCIFLKYFLEQVIDRDRAFLTFLIYIINLSFLQMFCSSLEPAGAIRNFNTFVLPKKMLPKEFKFRVF